MKHNHKYLWIQKKNLTESNFIIADDVIVRESDDDYPLCYNLLHDRMSRQKTVYEKDNMVISCGFRSVSMSGNFNELDDENRRIPFSYYDDSGNNEDTSISLIAGKAGYSIPETDFVQFQKTLTHIKKKKRTVTYSLAAIVVLLVALFIALK